MPRCILFLNRSCYIIGGLNIHGVHLKNDIALIRAKAGYRYSNVFLNLEYLPVIFMCSKNHLLMHMCTLSSYVPIELFCLSEIKPDMVFQTSFKKLIHKQWYCSKHSTSLTLLHMIRGVTKVQDKISSGQFYLKWLRQ